MFFDPSTKERGSLDPSCRVTAVGGGGLYTWGRSRPIFVYGQRVSRGGGKRQQGKKQVGCPLLDFLKVAALQGL